MANGAAPAPEPAVPAQDWSQYGTVQGPPDWSQYGVVRTPSAAKDIALSLGTGAVEGAMATAAAPGEMAELAQKGAQMFGVKPPTPGELAGRPPGSDVRLPRYNDIHSAIEEW